MEDEIRQQAIFDMITKTYEDMGMAIISIEHAGLATFKCQIINDRGLQDVFITVLLQMTHAHQR